MANTTDPVLEASMSRVQFTIIVDDLQTCFDDKKLLTHSFLREKPYYDSKRTSGFQFEVKFGDNSEDSFSAFARPLEYNTVVFHGLSVTVFDENMRLIVAKKGELHDFELTPGEGSGWEALCSRASQLNGAKGLRLQIEVIFGDKVCKFPIMNKRDVTLNGDMVRLYENAEATDVTFRVGKEQIKAHKAVLMARSSYFDSMFGSGMEETQTNLVEVKDADPDTFKELIKFLYSGLLPENIDAIGMGLLPIADRYGVKELQEMCEVAIRRNLSVENLIESLILAETHHCEDLMQSCLPLFKKNLKDLCESEKWKEMKNYPDLQSKLLASYAV